MPALFIYAGFALGVAALGDLAPDREEDAKPLFLLAPAHASTVDDSERPVEAMTVRLRTHAELDAALANARPPVPWMREAPAAYVAPSPETAVAAATAPAAPDPAREREGVAKAKIEEDGYRRVRLIERSPDGKWRATALRGETEVALVVDEQGRVSMQ